MINTAIKSLEAEGFVHIQYKGEEVPLSDEDIQELSSNYTRVIGFDEIFTRPTFSTITFVEDVEGLKSFLEVDFCKRYVRSVEITTPEMQSGVIKHLTPYVRVILNTDNQYINSFKSAFIGKRGNTIKELSKALDCMIVLREEGETR